MQTYISLIKLTGTGREEIHKSLKRGELVSEIMARNGVTRRDYFLTLGSYDFIMIFEAETAAGMAQTLVEIGRLGAIVTETMTAFGPEDYTKIQNVLQELEDYESED